MISKSIAKVAAVATGLAMATSMLSLAPIAHAASLTTAQVQSILSLLSSFGANSATIANVNAALTGGTMTTTTTGTTGTSSCTFSRSLTIGSTGADVTCLQQALIAGGFSIPAGATGYFGTQTRAAVASWQSSRNVAPAVGYFGPISQGAWNLGGSTTTTGTTTTTTTTTSTVAGCAAGATFSSTTGQACAATTTTTTTPPTGITTVGAEGSFTVTQAPQPASNTNVTTNSNTPVYGINVDAQGSDIVINRVDLLFLVTVSNGATVINPSGFVTSLSAWDGSTLLKTMPLTSTDFIKGADGNYYVRMTGINFLVLKDASPRTLSFTINTNSVSSVDYTRSVTIEGSDVDGATQNVRGVDGAGLSSYANATWESAFTFQASNNSLLTGTLDSSTPKAQTIATTSSGILGVTMQVFDLKSTTGASTLTNMSVTVGASAAAALPSALYLYDGSTLLSSVSAASGANKFANLSLLIAKDATKVLTVKADFPATAVGIASTSVLVTGTGTDYTTPDGTTHNITIASAIVGNDVHIYGTAVPVWTLVSATMAQAAGVVNVASSSLTGTIVLKVTANGGTLTKPVAADFLVWFASSTPAGWNSNGQGAGYSTTNAIATSSQSITVTPSDSTVGDGGSYTVTIVGNLLSSSANFGPGVGQGFNEFMAIGGVDATIGGVRIPLTGYQTWGIDTFYTPAALLTKSTL